MAKKPTDSADKKEDKTTVEAIHSISHNGVDYLPGQFVECDHEEAARLITLGAAR